MFIYSYDEHQDEAIRDERARFEKLLYFTTHLQIVDTTSSSKGIQAKSQGIRQYILQHVYLFCLQPAPLCSQLSSYNLFAYLQIPGRKDSFEWMLQVHPSLAVMVGKEYSTG